MTSKEMELRIYRLESVVSELTELMLKVEESESIDEKYEYRKKLIATLEELPQQLLDPGSLAYYE